jgi:hypothetical protein
MSGSAAHELASPLLIFDAPPSIQASYANTEQTHALFHSHTSNTSFLTREEALLAFPSGTLSHEFFTFKRQKWRILARREGYGPSSPLVFIAVADGPVGRDSLALSSAAGFVSPSRISINQRNRRLQNSAYDSPRASLLQLQISSRPLDIHVNSRHGSPFSSISSSLDRETQDPTLISHQLRESSPQKRISFPTPHNTPVLMKHSDASRTWTENLLSAESNHSSPLQRFKAFVKLIRSLPRPTDEASFDDSQCDQARSTLMVGEALARFGNGMTSGNTDNSSRAITTADYASLLSSYLKQCGCYYADSFISRLPVSLADEALAVRMLLEVRCSTNRLIFDKLISHCGLESPAGSTLIVNSNNNTLQANLSSSLRSKVQAAAHQAIMTINHSKGWLNKGLSVAMGILGLWALKSRLFRLRHPREERYRSKISRRKGNLAERLIDDRSMIERSAIHRLSVCENELASSVHNAQLLKDDWARIGGIRIGGGAPSGFREVNTDKCSLRQYLWDLGYDEREDTPREQKKAARN